MFYIYEWYIIETGEVIYVGKGTRNRYKASKKNEYFKYIVSEHDCAVRILEYFEDETDAFIAEKERIIELMDIGQCRCNKIVGGGGLQRIWTDERRHQMSINNPMREERQRQRMSEYNPMKNAEVARKVGAKKKRPVVINNIEYAGTVDAARELEVANFTILTWVKQGHDALGNSCYYLDEGPKDFVMPINKSFKPILIDGEYFPTAKSGADHYGWGLTSVLYAINHSGYFRGHKCEYANQQPNHRNSI